MTGALIGCGADDCERLCDTTRTQLRTCIQDWPVDWSEFDATGPADFREQCRSDWATVRSDLEPRELSDALDQCAESQAILTDLASSDEACDALRALMLGD